MRFSSWLALLSIACTTTPDDAPIDAPISEVCNACLNQEDGGGCGVEEQACADRDSCDDALLCALANDCWKVSRADACATERGCPSPITEDVPLYHAVEDCARSLCAEACGFVE